MTLITTGQGTRRAQTRRARGSPLQGASERTRA